MSLDSTLPRRGARRPLLLRVRRRLPRLRLRLLLVPLLVAGLAAGGWMWLRDASLAEVRDVEVTGVTSSEQPRIRAALEAAALDMTTLHVREAALRSAVAPFVSVADLRVSTDFPHRMRIDVIEHKPVAVLDLDGRRIPSSASGVVLRGIQAGTDLPVIRIGTLPAGDRVGNRNTLDALAIAGAAPAPLRARVVGLWTGPRGMMLSLRNGPDLIFGTSADAAAKWAAAARVLAEPDAAGATYLDLRIAERVAAGGLGSATETEPDTEAQTNPQPQVENSPSLNP